MEELLVEGLFILHPADKFSGNVDIVAVHGLGGNHTKTWRHPDTGAVWTSDFLPFDQPSARIMAFGYNANWFQNTVATRIVDHADMLLEKLTLQRRRCMDRPIIFICHSLGGIIVKRALLSLRERYQMIKRSTFGVVFMGTPHYGTNLASWLSSAQTLLSWVRLQHVESLNISRDLAPFSNALLDINRDFIDVANSITVVSFIEKKETWIGAKSAFIVEEGAAKLHHPNEHSLPSSATHQDLCKFPNRNDSRYVDLKEQIEVLVDEALASQARREQLSQELEFNDRHRSCLNDLRAYNYEDYLTRIPRSHEDTLFWIWNSFDYNEWCTLDKSKILAILGHPGCGKTVLAATLIRRLQDMASSFSNDVVIYSFCYAQSTHQNTGTSILRTLIHQLLKASPAVSFSHVLPIYNIHGKAMMESFDILWRLFQSLAQSFPGTIFCILDALDECQDESRSILFQHIRYMYESTPVGSRSVKMFITSRPNFQFQECLFGWPSLLQIKTADHFDRIEKDVNIVIEAKVKDFCDRRNVPGPLSTLIRETLKSKADGTFLWVDLVVKGLMDRKMVCSQEGITKYLANIPDSLKGVYSKLLEDIERNEEARRMLSWVVSAARPLTLGELNVALAIRPSDQSMNDVHRRMYLHAEQELLNVAGPFLRIQKEEVHLVHQSARDFLIDIGCEGRGMEINLATAHLELSTTCLTYITISGFQERSLRLEEQFNQKWISGFEDEDGECLDGFLESYRKEASDEQKRKEHDFSIGVLELIMRHRWVRRLLVEFPLLEYAGTYWTLHSRESGERTEYQGFRWIADYQSPISQQWALLCSIAGGLLLQTVGQNDALALCSDLDCPLTALEIVAFLGLQRLVHYFLENHTISPLSQRISQLLERALYAAIYGQHIQLLRSLLRRGVTDEVFEKALAFAVEHGKEKAIEEFLHQGLVQRYRVVHLGSFYGQYKIVQLALDGVLIFEWMDGSLLSACFGGHEAVVALLLPHIHSLGDLNYSHDMAIRMMRSSKNSRTFGEIDCFLEEVTTTKNVLELFRPNGRKWTPLMMASLSGDTAITELVLARSFDIPPRERSIDLLHSISLAMTFQKNNVFKYLLERREDDLMLSLIMIFASIMAQLDSIQALLDIDIELSFRPEMRGRTPIHTAALSGREEIVELLLTKYEGAGRSFCTKDDDGGTALSLAAKEGHLTICRSLLDSCGHVYDEEYSCWPAAITKAAKHGHLSVVETFLSKNSLSRNLSDQYGRTALSYAAEGGNLEILERLISADIEIDAHQDSSGRTPLSYAAENGHLSVARLLLRNFPEQICQTDDSRRTPLSYASEAGHLALVELLTEGEPGMTDLSDEQGRTPLSYAAENDHSEVVEYLLNHKSTSNLRDAEGRTPLSYGAENGCAETVAAILANQDTNWNAPDDDGKSPLYYAVTSGRTEVANLLVERVRSGK